MAKTAKKCTAILLAGLLLSLFLPSPGQLTGQVMTNQLVRPAGAAIRLPYAMEAAFFRARHDDGRRLPGGAGESASLYLAITVTPLEPGVSLYASKSQARGKVTEIAVAAGGLPIQARAVFPTGMEKPDPLVPGEVTRMFAGAFTALIPLPDAALAGKILDLRLTGLACSAVNCTPLVLTQKIPVPDAQARVALPDAAASPWWGALVAGVAEPLGDMPVPASPAPGSPIPGPSGVPRLGAVSLSSGSGGGTGGTGGAAISLAPQPGAFIGKITPVPFTPELEVASMGKAVLLGFLAGIILNLMPCVLPVLGIKLAALLAPGGGTVERVRRFRRHQLFFALGILVWFTVMAGLFHFLDLAWGQIFQSPVVVFALAVMLLLLALDLFGVFSLPLIDLRAGNAKNPDLRAFAEGFGATLLATPCGGPLLGGVLSWALMQPLGVLALTLECVGLGMACPYFLLAAFPGLAGRLPRPGAWMRTMEQILGFLLLGTVAYLVGFLPLGIVPRVVAALVLAAFGGWLWQKRGAARLFGVVCIALACVWPFMAVPATGEWTDYSHAAFEKDLGKRVMLVDFTADWCPTCKVVEATALRENNLRAWGKKYALKLVRVDMTRENPEGEALLRAVGSVSIPVIAVFRTGDDALSPLVLRDIVTAGQVEAALEAATAGR
ncbi:putative Protein-disulfide reductase [uncultured delta proteobacterium]|uniref:Thioredoxin domain-containing protein n=1 Tax=uncultured delta proteobacterium TaxID=34034 RepID=A0A212JM90_9DELT|nr:putative Protein-disulfide reductase [uncultured delta proteobacterium]